MAVAAAGLAAGLAGVEHGADPRDRLAAGQPHQRVRGLLRVLPGRGHPGGDHSGDYGGGERRPAPLGHPLEVPDLLDGEFVGRVVPGGEGVDEVFARRVDVDPRPEIAEARPRAPVRRQGTYRQHPAVGGRPFRARFPFVARGREQGDALQPGVAPLEEVVEAEQGQIEAALGGEGEHEDVRVRGEGGLQAVGDVRLEDGTRVVDAESPRDEHRCRRGCSAHAPGDERAVTGVWADVAVGVERVLLVALHPLEPDVGIGALDEAGVHDADGYAVAVAFRAVVVASRPGDAMARTAARVQAGEREGIGIGRHRKRLGCGAGTRRHVEYVVRPGHAATKLIVEPAEDRWYQRPGRRHREAMDPPAGTDRLVRDLPPFALGNLPVTRPLQDPRDRRGDAIRVLGAGENCVLVVQVFHAVDVVAVPQLGRRVGRRTIKVVQDQLNLRSRTLIYRHFYLLAG